MALKLLAAVASPVAIAAETVTVTASAGVALFPEDAADAAALLALAEAALRQAKRAGGQLLPRCRRAPRRRPSGDAALALALEQAIETDALVLLFQPQVTLCSADLGLAALVRWPHEPLRHGRGRRRSAPWRRPRRSTEPLTDWLLAAACRQAARWRAAGLPRLHVAVPLLSRRQLVWSDLAAPARAPSRRAGMAPAELELEIDEICCCSARATRRAAARRRARARGAAGGRRLRRRRRPRSAPCATCR